VKSESVGGRGSGKSARIMAGGESMGGEIKPLRCPKFIAAFFKPKFRHLKNIEKNIKHPT